MPDRELTNAKRILIAGTAALGIQLSPSQIDSFLTYLSLLLQWSDKFNLTSIREPSLVIRHHFLDSVAILPFITRTGRLMDVGSGAGFPALPIKIVLPEKAMILLDSNRKKSNFLREITRKLNLSQVEVIQKRAEELAQDEIGAFDEIVTRAFGAPELFLKLSVPLLSHKGRSLIMHGPKGAELFSRLEKKSRELGFREARLEKFKLPIGNEERRLLIFIKG